MSEEIIKVLDNLCAKFGIAIDWTSENVVPYLEQLAKKFINYEIATSIVWIAFWGLFLAIALIVARKAIPKADWSDEYDPWAWLTVLGVVLSIAFGIAFCVALIDQGMDITTCLTFPEKEIFEYVKTLM